MSKDILEAAIAYDDSLPSTAGDYLRYHYNRVIRRTYKGSNTDGEYYRFEYELYYLSSYEQEAALENRAAEILNELDVYSADRETQIRSVYAYIAQNVHYDNMIYDDFKYIRRIVRQFMAKRYVRVILYFFIGFFMSLE